ncbi:MAG: helicase-related protein [Pseudomonadota bacterium]
MDNFLHTTAFEIRRYLGNRLPTLDTEWWRRHVIDRLSFQQQRIAQERGFTRLDDLDLAALLRVFDQNWFELSQDGSLPREARNWIKELQTIRNKWAHRSGESIPATDMFRDLDTASRLLIVINGLPESLAKIEESKADTLKSLAGIHASPTAADKSVPQKNSVTPALAPSSPTKPASRFTAGELVCLKSNPSIVLPIIEVLATSPNEPRYRVFQNNAKATYYESQLEAVSSSDDERIKLTAEELNAHLTSLQILSPSTSNLYSLRSGRIKFIPYQYRPVLKLIRADRPRLLIADEVGVGKTIEAGLIIKELKARMDLSSVLIICPKALVSERKWFLEMKRFDEHFTALDGRLLRHCLRETDLDGEWPEQYAKAILPFSLFDEELIHGQATNGRGRRRDKGLLDFDPPPKFDLVIVDEAHHIRNPSTYLHQGIKYFCDNAVAVIFMTATPVQLGSSDLFTLLNVLRPDLIIDPTSFTKMAEPNRFINEAVHHCRVGKQGWVGETRGGLTEAAQTEWGRLFLRESPAFQRIYDQLADNPLDEAARVSLIRRIEELYTFSSLINRTRRRDIGEFTTRKPDTLTIPFTPAQQALHDRLLDVIAGIMAFCHGNQNVKFMMTTIRRQAASCLYGLAPLLEGILSGKLNSLEYFAVEDGDIEPDFAFVNQVRTDIEEVLRNARALTERDPKVEAFLKVLTDKQTRANNKALVFSTFRHTLEYLAKHTRQSGFRFGLVHGDIPDEERSELRRRFALSRDDQNAIDILLSSEVGCEGLDFQFCDLLINYDLPWNPMRIEQRIGRIDRYGQTSKAVAIVNLITPGTVDSDIFTRCLLRIGVFQHAIGGNEEILGEITEEIHNISENFELTQTERELRLQQLTDNKIRQIQEEQELETRQAELFGLNIPGREWEKEVAEADSFWLSPAALQGCVVEYLTAKLERNQEYLLGEKPLKTLRLGHEARNSLLEDFKRLPKLSEPTFREWERWLKGADPMLPVTFSQETAVENPKAVLLTVTHPLLRQAAMCFKASEHVHVCLKVKADGISPGKYQFGIYRWSKQGVKQDEILVPVASDPMIEEKLFTLLQVAEMDANTVLPAEALFDELDARHHSQWTDAQANHIAENRQVVEYRRQSLTVSHQARCKAIGDQLGRATNDKIRLMKQSELARANADYERRIQELEKAASGGDIHATPVVFGVIRVEALG